MFDGQMDGEVGRWVGMQACGYCSVRAMGPPPLGQAVQGSPGSWVGETDLTPESLLLSQIISQTWPYLSMIMENKFREKLEPKIREKSIRLRTFTFTKLYFGKKVGDVSGGAAWICRAVFSLSQTLPHVPHLTEDISGDLAGGPASQPQWRPRTPESQHCHFCRCRGSLAQREQKGKVGNESTFLQPSFENVP